MFGKEFFQIRIQIPGYFCKGIVIEIIENFVIGFAFQKYTVNVLFHMLQVFPGLPVHHGGDPFHFRLPHVFARIGPDGNFPLHLPAPVFQKFKIGRPVFGFSHSTDGNLNGNIVRDVAFRQTVKSSVCHLGYNGIDFLFFQASGNVSGIFP